MEAVKCYIYLAKKAHERLNCLADVLFVRNLYNFVQQLTSVKDEALNRAQELDEIFAKSGPVGPLHGGSSYRVELRQPN